jgi:hypothetical protein
LIDAVKSGRPWKEKGGTHLWLRLVKSAHLGLAMEDAYGNHTQVLPHHLTEKEWEIQEPEVKITRGHYYEVLSQMLKECGPYECRWFGSPSIDRNQPFQELARRLGLEP